MLGKLLTTHCPLSAQERWVLDRTKTWCRVNAFVCSLHVCIYDWMVRHLGRYMRSVLIIGENEVQGILWYVGCNTFHLLQITCYFSTGKISRTLLFLCKAQHVTCEWFSRQMKLFNALPCIFTFLGYSIGASWIFKGYSLPSKSVMLVANLCAVVDNLVDHVAAGVAVRRSPPFWTPFSLVWYFVHAARICCTNNVVRGRSHFVIILRKMIKTHSLTSRICCSRVNRVDHSLHAWYTLYTILGTVCKIPPSSLSLSFTLSALVLASTLVQIVQNYSKNFIFTPHCRISPIPPQSLFVVLPLSFSRLVQIEQISRNSILTPFLCVIFISVWRCSGMSGFHKNKQCPKIHSFSQEFGQPCHRTLTLFV